jgi:Flp pilus assembly protein TadB
MTMEAGANFNQALTIYVANNPHTTLSRDVNNALNRVQAGGGVLDAVAEMLPAISIDEVRRSIEAILAAERRGGSKRLAILKRIADDMRKKRWEDAERASQELRIKLALPTMLIVVALLILIFTPVVVQVGRSGLFG